jgi:hypothetical protein
MVLNAASVVPPLDSQHAPYRYFTQRDFMDDAVKKIITPEEVQKKGITLIKLSQIIQAKGLAVQPFFANTLNLERFRKILKNAIASQEFVIVNYLRAELQEQGDGHFSPLAAYDERTDRFLLLDVARFKYPPYWVRTPDLWKAVCTRDEGAYRGFLVIHSPESI